MYICNIYIYIHTYIYIHIHELAEAFTIWPNDTAPALSAKTEALVADNDNNNYHYDY